MLVHEAWLRLVGSENQDFAGRAHFLGAADEATRRKHRVRRGDELIRAEFGRVDLAMHTEGRCTALFGYGPGEAGG